MRGRKKIVLFSLLLAISCWFLVNQASADSGLRINEIMYSPVSDDADEWVEIYNPGKIEIRIIGGTSKEAWTFVDASGPHFLSEKAIKGSLNIGPEQFLIIAKSGEAFLKKYPDFSGHLVEAAMSLPNDFGYIQLKDGRGNLISQALWSFHVGADRNKKTLEFQNGIFRESTKELGTPGEINSVEGLILPPAPSPILPSPTPKPTPSEEQKTGKVFINEVFYSPGKNSSPWIELKNNETKKLNLDGWKIVEVLARKETFLQSPILANSFRVIEIPGLNKKTEVLQLFDAENKKVFEVKYSNQIPQDWSAARFENSTWKITSRPTPEKENIYFIPKEIKETFVPQELIPIINFENATSNQIVEPTIESGVRRSDLIRNGLFAGLISAITFVLIKKKLTL